MRELVDADVIGVVRDLEALLSEGTDRITVPHGCVWPLSSSPPKRVVAVEVVGVEQHLRELVPLVLRPAEAQRHRGGGHQQPELVRDLDLDPRDALLGREDPHVVLEAKAPGGVACARSGRSSRAGTGASARGRARPAGPAAGASAAAASAGPRGRGRRRPRARPEPRARPRRAHRGRRRARERVTAPASANQRSAGPVDPHAGEASAWRASSRASTRASMLPPVSRRRPVGRRFDRDPAGAHARPRRRRPRPRPPPGRARAGRRSRPRSPPRGP